jgi:hypothetical protein
MHTEWYDTRRDEGKCSFKQNAEVEYSVMLDHTQSFSTRRRGETSKRAGPRLPFPLIMEVKVQILSAALKF